MADDLVERLREESRAHSDPFCPTDAELLFEDAADEITRLRAELASLRGAVERCAKIAEQTKAYDDSLQKSGGCATTGERIAAAIRAQPKEGE